MQVWDALSGALVTTLKGYTGQVTSVCFSVDGIRLVSGSYDNSVKVTLFLSSHENTTSLTYKYERVLCSKCNIFSLRVQVWDAISGALMMTFEKYTSVVTSLCFSPIGTRLASGSWDKSIKVALFLSSHYVLNEI